MSALTLRSAVPLLASIALPLSVQAAEDTAQFNVMIEILESCDIASSAASDIDFGSHVRNSGAPVSAMGTLTVNCTDGTDYTIGLNEGQNATSTIASADNRRMTSGTDFVAYGLYRDASHLEFWGNEAGTNTLPGTGTATAQDITVYGRVPSTDVPPGSYTDIVTATITY